MTTDDKPYPYLTIAYESALQFLLDQGIDSLPINPFDLCEKNGWKTISVREFCKRHDYDEEFMLKNVIMSDYGAAIHFKSHDYYCIVYNDKLDEDIIQWTITHEIGHIVLGHFNSTASIIMKGVLSPEEYAICEMECEWFARTLLAPPPVLHAMGKKKLTQIQSLCGISEKRAGLSSLFIHGPWIMMEKNLDTERKVVRQFRDFIRDNKN